MKTSDWKVIITTGLTAHFSRFVSTLLSMTHTVIFTKLTAAPKKENARLHFCRCVSHLTHTNTHGCVSIKSASILRNGKGFFLGRGSPVKPNFTILLLR